MRGIGPRLRARWPLVLLLLSVGAIALAAVQATVKGASQRVIRERVLTDYASVATWNYERHLEEVFRTLGAEVLGAVNHDPGVHESPGIPHADVLVEYIPWNENCLCHQTRWGPSPDTLFSFVLGSDTTGVALNYYVEPDRGMLADPMGSPERVPPPAAAWFGDRYAWVNDTLTARIRARHPEEVRFPWLVRMREAEPQLVSYTVMPTSWGDTIVYAVMFNHRTLRSIFAAVLEHRELLPPAYRHDRDMRDIVGMAVTSADGKSLFRSYDVEEPERPSSSVRLPEHFGALEVRAHIRDAAAESLVIGGLPRSQLPFLIGLLVLATALAVVAFAQLTRENELARSRADFVASISHELRTPLAQVRLFLDTLRLGRADDERTRNWSLEQMDRETRRLVQLVDNVLVFSRGPSRLLEEPREPLDLSDELERIIEEYRPLAAGRRATIELDAEPGVTVTGSRNALRHALLNVLDNAVKYGPVGQTVHVQVEGDGARARVRVLDQGPGIPPAERERIWRAFERGRDPAARAAGGSGIGLAIVRELVAGHGGHVVVEDAPGGGACFTITLPRSFVSVPTPVS